MNIQPLNDSDFSLVELRCGKYSTKETPHCIKHGAMNKLTPTIWRCISTHGIQSVMHGKAESRKEIDNLCKAGCEELTPPQASKNK